MYSWDKLFETAITAEQAEEVYQRCMDEAAEYLKYNQSSEIKQHVIVETAIAETLKLVEDSEPRKLDYTLKCNRCGMTFSLNVPHKKPWPRVKLIGPCASHTYKTWWE